MRHDIQGWAGRNLEAFALVLRMFALGRCPLGTQWLCCEKPKPHGEANAGHCRLPSHGSEPMFMSGLLEPPDGGEPPKQGSLEKVASEWEGGSSEQSGCDQQSGERE